MYIPYNEDSRAANHSLWAIIVPEADYIADYKTASVAPTTVASYNLAIDRNTKYTDRCRMTSQ